MSTEYAKDKKINEDTRIGFDVPFKNQNIFKMIRNGEEVINVLKKIKFKCDYVFLLQPTSPLEIVKILG